MEEKFLFLDIDGVLNSRKRLLHLKVCGIDADKVGVLNWLTMKVRESTGEDIKIILSSSWRYMIVGGTMTIEGFNYMMKTHGVVADIVGMCESDEAFLHLVSPTLRLGYLDTLLPCEVLRAMQIRSFAEAHNLKSWAAVDDLDLGRHLGADSSRFIRTDGCGLSVDNAAQLLSILKD